MIVSRILAFCFILQLSLLSPLFAESLINDSLSLVDKNKTLVDPSRSLIDKNKTLVDRNLRLTDEKKTLVDGSKSLTPIDENAVGTYRRTVNKNIKSTIQNTVQDTHVSTIKDSYANNYGAFLKAVLKTNPQAKNDFVKYFADWQKFAQKEDFFSYSSSRAEREKILEYCYDQAVKRFGIGSAIIASTWVVAVVVPGGTIAYSTMLVITKATTWGAISGAVFDGLVSAGKSIYSGHSTDEIIYETIDGAAEGYLFGAVAGLASGMVHVAIMSQTAKKVKDMYVVFGEQVYDKSGRVLVDLSGVGTKTIRTASKLLEEQGDDALNALIKVAKKNPKRLSLAIGYMNAKGVNGVFDVLKWKGVIPDWITKSVIETAEKIAKSPLKLSMDALRKLPGIKLTTAQLDKIRQTPSYLKELVKELTDREFKDGYLEFFIRLTKNNPNQAQEIWNYSKAVRDVIKDAIRPGGTHEWLMCENFIDFLTDPKWRREGPYLAKILSVLTQNTNDVYLILRDGTKWTHTLESQMTFGRASNPKALIHNLIRNVIKKSNSTEDMLVNLEKMVKEKYPKEVYEKFSKALAKCFI